MVPLLLRIFGVRLDAADRLVGVGVELRNSSLLGWIVPLGLALGVLSWWLYRQSAAHATPGRRKLLTALRTLLLWLLLALLLRPVLTCELEGKVRNIIVCLLDASASMKIADPRLDNNDLKRAAIGAGLISAKGGLKQAMDPAKGAQVKQIARTDLLKDVLGNIDLALLDRLRKDYDLIPMRFGQTVEDMGGSPNGSAPAVSPSPGAAAPSATPAPTALSEKTAPAAPWLKNLTNASHFTAIGDAVRDVLQRERGQPLAGIFLATDGGNNRGSSPADAASFAGNENVPLYIYGVGITSPRDIIVSSIFTPEVAFARDQVAVSVRVRGQGLKGQSALLKLNMGDKLVANQVITFTDEGEQTIPLMFKPTEAGEFVLKASIDARPDEAVKENNSAEQKLRIIDRKIQVLFVEQNPRWEFRYLQAILLRDNRIELKCVLIEGDPSIAQGANSPYLAKIPDNKADLFKYDLIIIGDVDPKAFSATQYDAITEFVSKFGGSLIVMAGHNFSPAAYRRTPLEKLLPIELGAPSAESVTALNAQTNLRPISLELTAAGRLNPMLRLSDQEDESLATWKGLAPIFWTARVAGAKPAAEVLLVDPDPAKTSRAGKMPVLASQPYGTGQVLYVGTDNLWRWRKNKGEQAYNVFWGQVTGRMALTHLLGGAKRTQLSTDKQGYVTGDRVTIYARLYQEGFVPITTPTVKAEYTVGKDDATKTEVQLRALPDQPGIYRGEFNALKPGDYQFSVETDPKAPLKFVTTEPKFEPGETAMNEAQLRDMAKRSGGAFYREEDLIGMPDLVAKKTEHVRTTIEAELWSSPLVYGLIFAVAVTEWILRKKLQLK